MRQRRAHHGAFELAQIDRPERAGGRIEQRQHALAVQTIVAWCSGDTKASAIAGGLTIANDLFQLFSHRPLFERVGSDLRHLRILIGRDAGHADPANDCAV